MPDPGPTRIVQVGENQHRNQPVLMVGSSNSSPSVSSFAASAEISSDPARSTQYLAESVESGLDLNKISSDLVDFK